MHALPIVESPLRVGLYDEAVALYRRARQSGRTVRSSVDCLTAACALRHHLTVLHHDRDFGELAAVSGLQARAIRPAR
jgi:predicted nucleic acid-binding protein